ncbi:hypothetical protein [Azotobacter chroococcum]|uniref:hypothetical protein n=1 Tax=Azotobacter chroococcum TaxID=353 RepID=UPI000B5F6451|nr:hypothetical protein [Azotobacter chroococcum]ASL26737.1 hypothetical protein ACG10_10860 [Azotobacter chroococcum]
MTAKTAAERKREERERKKLKEEERLVRLLSRRIKLDLFHATDAKLIRSMERTGIEEPQDLITRLIHGADRLSDEALAELIRLP